MKIIFGTATNPHTCLFADEDLSPAKGEKRKRDPEEEEDEDDD